MRPLRPLAAQGRARARTPPPGMRPVQVAPGRTPPSPAGRRPAAVVPARDRKRTHQWHKPQVGQGPGRTRMARRRRQEAPAPGTTRARRPGTRPAETAPGKTPGSPPARRPAAAAPGRDRKRTHQWHRPRAEPGPGKARTTSPAPRPAGQAPHPRISQRASRRARPAPARIPASPPARQLVPEERARDPQETRQARRRNRELVATAPGKALADRPVRRRAAPGRVRAHRTIRQQHRLPAAPEPGRARTSRAPRLVEPARVRRISQPVNRPARPAPVRTPGNRRGRQRAAREPDRAHRTTRRWRRAPAAPVPGRARTSPAPRPAEPAPVRRISRPANRPAQRAPARTPGNRPARRPGMAERRRVRRPILRWPRRPAAPAPDRTPASQRRLLEASGPAGTRTNPPWRR